MEHLNARTFQNVGLLTVAAVEAPEVVTSAWIDEQYPKAEWMTEVSITAPRADGSQTVGVIDILLRLADGSVVIVDHKSSPVSPENAAAKAGSYAGQLAGYREALEAQGMVVRDTWIHLAVTGVMAKVG